MSAEKDLLQMLTAARGLSAEVSDNSEYAEGYSRGQAELIIMISEELNMCDDKETIYALIRGTA